MVSDYSGTLVTVTFRETHPALAAEAYGWDPGDLTFGSPFISLSYL